MQVGDAAARRGGRALVQDAATQGRPAGAYHLRYRAAQIVAADVIDAPQRAQQPLTLGRDMGRRDADDRASGNDEHDDEIGQRRDRALRDLLDGVACGTLVH